MMGNGDEYGYFEEKVLIKLNQNEMDDDEIKF